MTSELEQIIETIDSFQIHDLVIKEESGNELLPFHLYTKREFALGQIGYRMDLEGNSLTGSRPDEWNENWYVIGFEEEWGDPLFVDVKQKEYPVMTTRNEVGPWKPKVIFTSIDELKETIKITSSEL